MTPLLNIYGGKLTTYRKLSEKVMENYLLIYLILKIKNWTSLNNYKKHSSCTIFSFLRAEKFTRGILLIGGNNMKPSAQKLI